MSQVSPKNKKIKAEKTRRPPKKITESYLHNAGLYYLERFAASAAHFRKVMMRKIDRSCKHHTDQKREECIALLDNLIKKFEEIGLLNDDVYSRGMVNSLRRRGLSARMIQAKLSAKGLNQDRIAAALAEYEEDTDENAELMAALRLARRKKLGPYKKEEQPFEKSLSIMARAGFSYDIAQHVLSMDEDDALRISESGGC